MIKRSLLIFSLILIVAGYAQAQWTNVGAWPDNKEGQTHGLTVDPDGKVWVSDYNANNKIISGTDTLNLRSIIVYNADGTQASFSPISFLTINGVQDTLLYSTRGMRADQDGNIIYVDGDWRMFRIDYRTGAGMTKLDDIGYAPTTPGIDANGNIFVGPVIPGNPVKIFDKDFSYVGNAIDATTGYARTALVSKDGNTFYWPGYTNAGIYIYNRPDEFASFDSVGIIEGFKTEAIDWNPKTNRIWAGAGETGYAEPGIFNGYQLTSNSFYEIDLENMTLTDSLKWNVVGGDVSAERQRGIGFSPDGLTAYIGTFGASGTPLIQKVVKGVLAPVSVTFQVNMGVQVVRGNFIPGTDVMHVSGSFNGWSTSATELSDTDADTVYTVTVDSLVPGDQLQYKFVINTADAGYESVENRTFTVPASDATIPVVYFNNDNNYTTTPVAITFSVNMEYEIVSGRFSPTDTLSVERQL